MRYDSAVAIIKQHLNRHVESTYMLLLIKVKYTGTTNRQVTINMRKCNKKDHATHQTYVKDNSKLKNYT